jgi:hypothetical protein
MKLQLSLLPEEALALATMVGALRESSLAPEGTHLERALAYLDGTLRARIRSSGLTPPARAPGSRLAVRRIE